MSNVRKIVDAFAALAAAMPGAPQLTVNMHGSQVAYRALMEIGATTTRYTNDRQTEEWDCAEVTVGNASIYAYSAHRPIVRVETDSAKVEAALSLANAAAQP